MSRQRVREETGFTLIEVLITCMLLAIAVVVLISTFDYSRRQVTTAEANEVASHKAEAEIERIMSLSFESIALPTAPTQSSDPANPDYYVTGSSYQWDQGATGPKSDPLVVDPAAGQVTPLNQTWTDGQNRLGGSIYRYVTTVAGTNGKARRVTVVVTVNGNALRKPVLISSIKTDPDD
jgi:prepilin-type N-terminal cleavage/methylation domain-containing protein